MKSAVVLGSSGFIGRNLVRFLKKSYSVIGVDQVSGTETQVIGDLTNESIWAKLPGTTDFVINAAAIVGLQQNVAELDYILSNTYVPLRAGRYAESVGAHYSLLSTAGIYGFREETATEATHPNPADIYSLSKYQGEMNCIKLLQQTNLLVLRLNFPYGPGQNKGLVPKLIDNISKGLPVTLNTSDGKPKISPVYIEDLIEIIVAAMQKKLCGTYNCGGKEDLSILEISKIIEKTIGIEASFSHSGKPCLNLTCSSEKLYKDSGQAPSCSFEQGVKNIIKKRMENR